MSAEVVPVMRSAEAAARVGLSWDGHPDPTLHGRRLPTWCSLARNLEHPLASPTAAQRRAINQEQSLLNLTGTPECQNFELRCWKWGGQPETISPAMADGAGGGAVESRFRTGRRSQAAL